MKRLKLFTLAAAFIGLTTIHAEEMQVTDQQVLNAVESEIWLDDAISANNVDVSVLDGIVKLEGTVRSLYAKERLEKMVATLVGVRSVVNLVLVVPAVVRSDEEIRTAVENALLRDPATESYEVQTSVSNGVVMLDGVVDSYAEYTLSEEVAKTVPGVSGVGNEINIRFVTDRLDSEIKAEVEQRLKNDVRIDDHLMMVTVKDGQVVLSGVAGSLQEKRQAKAAAWVSGVKDVDVSGLTIRWWARDEMRREALIDVRTDEEIKKAVEDAFLYDPRVYSFKPEVHVQNGIVSLHGIVTDALARKAAEEDARNTVGVFHVRNNLKTRPDIPGNALLAEQIEIALMSSLLLAEQDIDVSVNDGWVTLSGTVETSFEKVQAEQKALRVPGVVGVINRIDFNRYWQWMPDRELKREVEEQLFWSAFVDSDSITVSVNNGVVTLRGSVSSWSEYDDAETNAYQAGAKGVKNELQVASPDLYGPVGPSFVTGFPGVYPYSYYYYP